MGGLAGPGSPANVPKMRLPMIAAVLLSVACGGGTPAVENPTVNADASGTSNTSSSMDAGPTTTTNMTLPDSGNLEGTKLVTHTQTMVENPNAPGADGGSMGPSKDPGRTKEDVMAIIQAHRPEARACYDSAVKMHPGIAGKLDVTWKIDVKGNVTEVGVDATKSDIHEPTVILCVQSVIRGIKFAESPRGLESTMHYPFDFKPH